ncbi:hypothetical protein [Arthrobacter sp. PGP41]|uniref:hypothetical protein n=1 Tax=Arthrobacter sp. PGP41 TaxID=2079227 RepID=UPI00131A3164|nr:hypothetical protein [Arthrobacter sp. PGP41]
MPESTTEMTGAMIDPVTGEIIDQKELAERLLAQAGEQGVSLVGPSFMARPDHPNGGDLPGAVYARPRESRRG